MNYNPLKGVKAIRFSHVVTSDDVSMCFFDKSSFQFDLSTST